MRMTKKLRCTVTGNISYFTPQRYSRLLARYRDEETLKANYVSMVGRRVIEGKSEMPTEIRNRIKCRITGKWCFISDERIRVSLERFGSWNTLCANYISREAARLLREGKSEEEIRVMSAQGLLDD